MLKKMLLELIGAFLITFVMAFCRVNNPSDYLTAGITYFLVTASLTYAFKSVSGGYFNPILCLSLIFSKQISVKKALAFSIMQLLGSILAGFAVYGIYVPSEDAGKDINYGEPRIKEDSKLIGAFLEFLAMFMLVYVYSSIVCNIRAPKYVYGAAIGGVYSMALITMSNYSGGCVNIITYLGPAIFSGYYDDLVTYTFSHLTGGIISAIFHSIFLSKNVTEVDDEDEHHDEMIPSKPKVI